MIPPDDDVIPVAPGIGVRRPTIIVAAPRLPGSAGQGESLPSRDVRDSSSISRKRTIHRSLAYLMMRHLVSGAKPELEHLRAEANLQRLSASRKYSIRRQVRRYGDYAW
jgi:hypothetical protein